MKPYFIQDDDANYLNPNYIFNIQVIRFCNLGSLFAFETIKKQKRVVQIYQVLKTLKHIMFMVGWKVFIKYSLILKKS